MRPATDAGVHVGDVLLDGPQIATGLVEVGRAVWRERAPQLLALVVQAGQALLR